MINVAVRGEREPRIRIIVEAVCSAAANGQAGNEHLLPTLATIQTGRAADSLKQPSDPGSDEVLWVSRVRGDGCLLLCAIRSTRRELVRIREINQRPQPEG